MKWSSFRTRNHPGDIASAYKVLYRLILLTGTDKNEKLKILKHFIEQVKTIDATRRVDKEALYTSLGYCGLTEADINSLGVDLSRVHEALLELDVTRLEMAVFQRTAVNKYPEMNAAQARIAVADLVYKELYDNKKPSLIILMDKTSAIDQAIFCCQKGREALKDIAAQSLSVQKEETTDYFHILQSQVIEAKLKLFKEDVPLKEIRAHLDSADYAKRGDSAVIARSFMVNRFITGPDRLPGMSSREGFYDAFNGIKSIAVEARIENAKLILRFH